MKKLQLLIYIVLITIGISTTCYGANFDDHMRYKIITYSLGSDNTDGSESSLFYSPLLITGITSSKFNDSFTSDSNYGFAEPGMQADVFALSADYVATPELSLHGAIGVTQNRWDDTFDSDYETSWEANLGVIYQLFNNIRYEVHFGYMETGDLFRENETYDDIESIIMISNKLTMSF